MFLRFLAIAGLCAAGTLACTRSSAPIAAVDGRRLPLGVDSLRVYLIRGNDTTQTGGIIDALTTGERDGRQLLYRVYESRDQVLSSGVDSLTDELVTLRPVRHRSRRRSGAELLDYSGQRVTGMIRGADGDSVIVDTSLPGVVFNSSSFDLVLRAAPLAEGWSATVPAFLPSSRSVVALTARVAGLETIGGQQCWRVEADFEGTPVTFWITQDGHKLRQQPMRIRPDVSILFSVGLLSP